MAMNDLKSQYPESQVPVLTSDDAAKLVLRQLVQRFYGVDPVVDARLDAHAAQIFDVPGLKKIPSIPNIGPRVGLYFEGEPGVGKTSCIRSACMQFAAFAGLNYVDIDRTEPGYVLDPDRDFLQVLVNLSGKTNTSDVGGMPFRKEMETSVVMDHRRKAAGSLAWLSAELASRLQGASLLAQFAVEVGPEYERGASTLKDIRLKSDPSTAMDVLDAILGHMTEEAKATGLVPQIVTDAESGSPDTNVIRVQRMEDGVDITVCGPTPSKDLAREYVAAVLPNDRMATLSKAKFGLLNLDDVANASESVRNVGLELVQMGRLSGVADAGSAVVTMTGNMGVADNTNTMSERSDAETTRMLTVRVVDTPKSWAQRMGDKYAGLSKAGELPISGYVPEFVEKYGTEKHVFSAGYGDDRIERGVPKPNSRSLENALWSIAPYFKLANDAGISVTHFMDEIRLSLLGTVGSTFETLYSGFLTSITNDARPLAQELVQNGSLSPASMDRFQSRMGDGLRSTEVDFGFTFAICLCDEVLARVETEAATASVAGLAYDQCDPLRDATKNAFAKVFAGVDMLNRSSEATFMISRIADGLRAISRRHEAKGIADSMAPGAALSPSLCLDASEVFAASPAMANPNLIKGHPDEEGDIRGILASIMTNSNGLTKSSKRPATT